MSGRVGVVPRLMVGLVAVGLVLAGCGSSSKNSSTSPTTSTSGSAGSTGGPASTSGGTSGNTASAPGVTPTTIKVGFIASFTGSASSSYSTAEVGAKAVFNAINKAGGIDGRQLELVTADDMSSPAGALAATQDLMNQGVFAIICDSSYFFGAYKAAQEAGIPVTGDGFDGPEWGQQPNTNMFSASGGVNPTHEVIFADIPAVALFKSIGVTNVGGLAYGISPSSIASIRDMKTALQDQGLKMGYEDLAVSFGTTDVTAPVLAMKQAGVDMGVCSCVQSTALALVTALKQAGTNAKSLSLGGADSTLFSDSSAAQAAQGVYYSSSIPPLDTNSPASTTFENNIKAVDSGYQMGTYPTFGITAAYLGATVAVEGLQVAGQNPTRQSYIADLTKVTNWDANGLLPGPISFNHFGTSDSQYCLFYVHVVGQTFVHVPGGNGANGAFCGNVPANL